ncbi:MgtC/SapB family protein [Halarchaeum grantii]|uniref:MgtC/SapB family protein n=1 Tax=Halarchaeum grantii TaxID=1193105 RepID=UPI0016652AD2|nr:MgtC/SapB family protein [Halarchaeum grantii]
MADLASTLAAAPIDSRVVRLGVAVGLGLFLGLEREWSQKAAGIRTFALISVLGTVFTTFDAATCGVTPVDGAIGAGCLPLLSAVGAGFVVVLAGVLMLDGLRRGSGGAETSLHLTTAVSLLVAYGVGLLVGLGEILPATVVAVTSSLLLVFKRELHELAWGLSAEELRSTAEFAIIAFVVYPLLPAGTYTLGVASYGVQIEPRVVWLMVVFVAGIGIANYVVVKAYGSRGIAVTGFFGGLASSTAVVGTMLDHVSRDEDAADYAVAGVLLANAAMALRNLVIVVVFTLGYADPPLVAVGVPLAVVVLGSVAVAYAVADWRTTVDVELSSPFSLRNALGFGAIFLLIVAGSGLASGAFGALGFYVTAVGSGLVSSAGVATSAVVLYRTGELAANEAAVAVMLATGASIVVKAGLAAASSNRAFARGVVTASAGLLVAAGVAVLLV